MARNVTDEPVPAEERFAIWRLCDCIACGATGKVLAAIQDEPTKSYDRCPACRGEGRTRDLVATCATPEALGVTLYTLALEGEFDECPIGILDRIPEPGNPKWLIRPWLPSARNISDAGRTLAHSKKGRS